MNKDPQQIALAYLDAVGTHQLDRLTELMAPNVRFVGPVMSFDSRDKVIDALRTISAVHVRNDVKRVFTDGNEVCVIYDLVTDAFGSLPSIEWLKIADGRIASINLYYDQVPWQKIRQELARRATA
jgi:ketosteroid isomerase-like protein